MDRAAGRLKVLAFVVAFMFIALTTRLWFLQVLAGPQHERDARDNSMRTVETDALRGDILDRQGRTLVHNRLSLEVRINRDELGDEAESTLAHLSEILGVPAQELGEQLGTKLYYSYQPVPVAEFVPEEVYFKMREEPERFPGVEVVEQSVRSYPQGRLGAHLVGWVGQIDAEELERPRFSGYGPSDLVGKAGIEAYEPWLRGEPGQERFLVNSDGEVLREFDPRPASPATTSGSRSTSTSSGSPRKSCRRASSARGPCTTRARIAAWRRTPARSWCSTRTPVGSWRWRRGPRSGRRGSCAGSPRRSGSSSSRASGRRC